VEVAAGQRVLVAAAVAVELLVLVALVAPMELAARLV
jgi:hypothetical protein